MWSTGRPHGSASIAAKWGTFMALAGQAHSSSRGRCLCGAPDLRAVDLWPALRGVWRHQVQTRTAQPGSGPGPARAGSRVRPGISDRPRSCAGVTAVQEFP